MATLVIEKIKNFTTNTNFVGIFPIPGSNGAYFYKLKPDMTIDKIPATVLPDVEMSTVMRLKFYDGTTFHELNYIPERDEAFLKTLLLCPDIISIDEPEEARPTAQFRVYIKEERNKAKSEDVMNRSKTITKAACMTDDQLRKVCFYFRLPAQDWTRDEMIINLVGTEDAELFKKPVKNGKVENRMQMFLSEQFSTDFEFEVTSNVNKAITLGIIVFRSDMYYYGEKGIGSTIEHAILYFKENKDAYENGLKKSVGTTYEHTPMATDVEEEKPLTDAERMELETEAKRYGIKGDIKNFKDETLVAKVREARAMRSGKDI